MLIAIDTSPCIVALSNECVRLRNDIKIVRTLKSILYNSIFFNNFFSSFNPNRGYGNQRWLFSGNLPGEAGYR